TIKPYRKQRNVRDRDQESFRGLTGKRTPRSISDRTGDHDRNPAFFWIKRNVSFFVDVLNCVQSRFGIQRIEDSLHQDDIGTSVEQSSHLLGISFGKLVKSNRTVARIIYVRRKGGSSIGWAYGSGHEPGFVGLAGGKFVCDLTC